MNFEISEGKTVLYFYGNVINLGGGGGCAIYSCAFSQWVIEDTTEVKVLYQPEITTYLHITLSGHFLRNVNTVEPWIASIIHSRNVLVIQNTRISK
jgi:hypothetical protein